MRARAATASKVTSDPEIQRQRRQARTVVVTTRDESHADGCVLARLFHDFRGSGELKDAKVAFP